jgi:DNA (cytosine-5)-methyltransferase 1
MASTPWNVVSLFSGCGGMDLGFIGDFRFLDKHYHQNPFRITWANDLNQYACKSYAHNIGDHIRCGDVWELIDTIPDSPCDVVIGGFPCQDISINGKGLGINGKRSGLYRAMVEVVRRHQPRIFLAENVKGLLMKHNQESLKTVLNDFADIGYKLNVNLYNAAEYGVPQTRERVIIVGTRQGEKDFIPPEPIFTSQTQFVTASRAIGDLENMDENPDHNHIWSQANKSPDQGSRSLAADRAGYTVRAECHGNIHYHYSLPRRISMREAARLQSFPDNFIFQSKLRETERQIGNAVPPVLAWHLAQSTNQCLNTSKEKIKESCEDQRLVTLAA